MAGPTAAASPGQVLRDRFGFDAFRPGQEAVVAALLRDGAALAVFPTGAGKSLCYQLPALLWDGVTLVVSPLIALMKDQIDDLRLRGIPAARLDSSLDAAEARAVGDQVRSGALKLLYVAPERFANERFRGLIERTPIELMAIDEAHCISEWGHAFRPDYLKLAQFARDLGARRVLALTATATPRVVEDICAGFAIPPGNAVVTGFYRPNVRLRTTPVAADARDDLLVRRIRSRPPGSAIVYVTLQRTAERVARMLTESGVRAWAYHAGMDAEVRHRVQEDWMASDRGVVVATIAFGMGIDKPDVRAIWHYNLPKSPESYSQEIGRAGRDGLASDVELFVCQDDVPTLENFAYGDTPTEAALEALVREVLEAPTAFAVAPTDLSNRCDLRPLVLRTALTYLELDGILRQDTPVYAGYEVKPLEPPDAIAGRFPGERGAFLRDLFGRAKKGRIWYMLNPEEVAAALGQSRDRVVRALDYLHEQGQVELRATDLRYRYTRLREEARPDTLVAALRDRFLRHEAREIGRLARVLDLAASPTCQVNALVGYFGEHRAAPCGHCTVCESGPVALIPPAPRPPLDDAVPLAELGALAEAHPRALADPRQRARFLCGLASPALSTARLTRHALFGAADAYRFADVLAWCNAGSVPTRP